MSFVPIILMLLAGAPQGATAEANPALGSVVFECDFGATVDRNYDGWPDGWTRRHGPGFHDFLKIGIAEDKQDSARGSALVFAMNGGSAEVESPKTAITPSFSYVLEGECRLTGLMHDDARISLTFLNAKGEPLQSQSTPLSSRESSGEWRSFRLGPFIPNQHSTAASITLQVAPRGMRQDLRGQAAFRRLRLQRLPRMTVRTKSPLNIFTEKSDVEVQCEIAGIPHSQSTLQFELQDHDGRNLATHVQQLTTGPDAGW